MSLNDNANIQFSFTGLPDGYCFTTPQRFALDITAGLVGFLPGEFSAIIVSDSEPSSEDRSKLWYKLLVGGSPVGFYKYYLGKWVSPNPRRDPNERVWFMGSESAAWSYDGGDGTDPSSNIPTATTGAMWEVDHDFDFRFPLAAGTSPKPTTVSVGDNGGEEDHILSESELAPHSHPISYIQFSDGREVGIDWGLTPPGQDEVGTKPTSSTGGIDGVAVGHNNMPPYRVGMWLKPTGRLYYVA